MTWSWFWVLKFFKNIIPSLSYGRYRLVPNRGTFWRIFTPNVTFCGFQCFHFHMSLFLSISFQTPLKNPSRRAGGTKASGFVPPSLRDGFLRGVINCEVRSRHCHGIPPLEVLAEISPDFSSFTLVKVSWGTFFQKDIYRSGGTASSLTPSRKFS